MARQYEIPGDLYYTKEHEWARLEEGAVVVGITQYASNTLNDVVYISLPSIGQELKQSGTFGTVESTKAVSELYAPLSGKVAKVNTELVNHPELVNQSPYLNGWIIEMVPSNLEQEKEKLLNADQYGSFLDTI